MPNGIYGYHGHVRAYQRVAHNQETASAPAEVSASRSATQASASQPEAQLPPDLSPAEQQMIRRYFPSKTEVSMRLYGPHRGAQTLSPGAIGSHLDVTG